MVEEKPKIYLINANINPTFLDTNTFFANQQETIDNYNNFINKIKKHYPEFNGGYFTILNQKVIVHPNLTKTIGLGIIKQGDILESNLEEKRFSNEFDKYYLGSKNCGKKSIDTIVKFSTKGLDSAIIHKLEQKYHIEKINI